MEVQNYSSIIYNGECFSFNARHHNRITELREKGAGRPLEGIDKERLTKKLQECGGDMLKRLYTFQARLIVECQAINPTEPISEYLIRSGVINIPEILL